MLVDSMRREAGSLPEPIPFRVRRIYLDTHDRMVRAGLALAIDAYSSMKRESEIKIPPPAPPSTVKKFSLSEGAAWAEEQIDMLREFYRDEPVDEHEIYIGIAEVSLAVRSSSLLAYLVHVRVPATDQSIETFSPGIMIPLHDPVPSLPSRSEAMSVGQAFHDLDDGRDLDDPHYVLTRGRYSRAQAIGEAFCLAFAQIRGLE